jgi:hypothetical protein
MAALYLSDAIKEQEFDRADAIVRARLWTSRWSNIQHCKNSGCSRLILVRSSADKFCEECNAAIYQQPKP